MKKIIKYFLIVITLFTVTPVFADTVDCGIISEFTRPAAKIIMIIAPILVLVLGTFDFLKAVSANDEKAMKVAVSTFLKRLLIAAIIIILPVIVNMVISFTTFKNLTSCL